MSKNQESESQTNPHGKRAPSSSQGNESISQDTQQATPATESTAQPGPYRRGEFQVMDLQVIFDLLILIATSIYAVFAYHQWQEMREQKTAMQGQLTVMNRQLESMNSSSAQSERLIEANESLAEAARSSARAAQEGAEIARQSFYIGDRPYIAATAMIDKFEAGVKPRIAVKLSNSGKTPALEVRVAGQVSIGALPSPKHTTRTGRIVFQPSIASMPTGSIFTLPAAESMMAFLEAGETLTETNIAEIEQGKSFLFVFGLAFYKDALGRRHQLEYCMFYSPVDEIFIACAEFNTTK